MDQDPPVAEWLLRGRRIGLNRPLVVAILNVTPDSFSDGGRYLTVDAALQRAEAAIEEGADVLDIGGESTRPDAKRIGVAEEMNRVIPVLRVLRDRFPGVVLSVDTTRSEVARAALLEGADAINDVSGLRLDDRMAERVAAAAAGLVVMHSRGDVDEMASYALAEYTSDVVGDVVRELWRSCEAAVQGGVARESIVVDPGIGFSKRAEHSIAVLRDLPRLAVLGQPIMVGASRKRVIGDITRVPVPEARADGTVGAHVAALAKGARLFRVHDVRAHRHALDVAWRILEPTERRRNAP
jgi:dihydropteroate synthase